MSLPSGGKMRRDLEMQLAARAWTDEAFKQELLRDPKGVLEREFQLTLPPGVSVQVHEERPDELHMVLPMDSARFDKELSDLELDAVSGGKAGSTTQDEDRFDNPFPSGGRRG